MKHVNLHFQKFQHSIPANKTHFEYGQHRFFPHCKQLQSLISFKSQFQSIIHLFIFQSTKADENYLPHSQMKIVFGMK